MGYADTRCVGLNAGPRRAWGLGHGPKGRATQCPSPTAARCAVGAKRVKVERTLRTEGPPRVYLDARSETATITRAGKETP